MVYGLLLHVIIDVGCCLAVNINFYRKIAGYRSGVEDHTKGSLGQFARLNWNHESFM